MYVKGDVPFHLIVPHYDLQPIFNDHNGNKSNTFLFFLCHPWYKLARIGTLQMADLVYVSYVHVC